MWEERQRPRQSVVHDREQSQSVVHDREQSQGFHADQMWQVGQHWLFILVAVMVFGGIVGGWWAIILTVMRLL